VEPDDVRRALRDAGVLAEQVRAVGDGWANWTFLVDDTLIVRFPRNPEVAQATRRELRILPAISDHVSFAVPVPTVEGEWAGHPFFGYEAIAGRPLHAADRSQAQALGRMLAELHSFPAERAADLLGAPAPRHAWQDRYEQLWPVVEQVALPQLDDPTADAVRRNYSRMVGDPPAFPTCFIHNDLGPVHVLIGDAEQPVGMIDFEDAWLGDPATDLMPLAACLGGDLLPQLTAGRDLGERLDERITFYRWMASIHAIIYGVREQIDHEREAGVQALRRRLPAR
jgi:aminoglycoside phosphotransferase (APT) family kinase protein